MPSGTEAWGWCMFARRRYDCPMASPKTLYPATMRRQQSALAGQMPRLRRLEQPGRGGGRSRHRRQKPSGRRIRGIGPIDRRAAAGRHRGGGRGAQPHRPSRAGPRTGRRPGGRRRGADRRRPGIGKSTLLLQALDSMQHRRQHPLRDRRRKWRAGGAACAAPGPGRLRVAVLADQLEKSSPRCLPATGSHAVIDSIKTIYSDQLTSAPGSVAQVRGCARA